MSHQDSDSKANTQNVARKITPDVVRKLTDKLSEIMGEDLTGSNGQAKNERGEFLNEEGLPIIDITEPVEMSTIKEKEDLGNAVIVEESPLPDIYSLPTSARDRILQERDALLDQLEEEERLEEKKEGQAEIEKKQESLQKLKEIAAKEKENMKAAKEMHKKMGRMLLQNLAKERAEEQARVNDALSSSAKRDSNGKKNKKTVTFAEPSDDDQDLSHNARPAMDWGDITPARLRPTGRTPLSLSSDTLPMKMTVVERIPAAPPKPIVDHEPDSDDESEPEIPSEDHETEDADGMDSDLLEEDEEGYDMDFAQHQREIALEYYEKRDKIGAAALAAMTAHSHDGDGEVRVDLPLDMPSSEPEKPTISRFKATRFASSYAATAPSTSMGASIVPASTARTLQKAVRTGKLDSDNRLVGGDADSASEEEETEGMQEMLELLKKGEVYNVGPDGDYLHIPPSSAAENLNSGPSSTPLASTASNPIFENLPPLDRPKTSKFKLTRAAVSPSGSLSSNQSSRNETPISVAERSSPKTPSSMTDSVLEETTMTHPVMNVAVSERTPTTRAGIPVASPNTFPSMIVDSPTFPATATASGASPLTSNVIDSPSFMKPATPMTSSRLASRPSRPPAIMSSVVREASPSVGSTPPPTQTRTGKVSRFMAERS
ncbi:hypothetical protein H0H92_005481 [Tricholoma furcatifolium]|nr:hypothetical protein H0H92_005481 [Tricholoma furcatifolium]